MNLETKTLSEVVELLEVATNIIRQMYDRWDSWDQKDYPCLGIQIEDFLFDRGVIYNDRPLRNDTPAGDLEDCV